MNTDDSRTTTTPEDTVGSEGGEPDEGPTMSAAGAMPSGSEMSHWDTSMPNPDATGDGPVTGTVSKPMPGEKDHAERAKAAKVLSTD